MYNFFILSGFMINVLSVKTVNTAFFASDLGTLISPFVFAYMDILTETKGKSFANRTVKSMGVVYCIMSCLLLIVSRIPSSNADIDSAFFLILGNNWRFIFASLVATILGGICNNNLMHTIKGRYTVRAICSSIVGQLVDNSLFTVIAFAPVLGHAWELSWLVIIKNIASVTAIELMIESLIIVPVEGVYLKKKRGL